MGQKWPMGLEFDIPYKALNSREVLYIGTIMLFANIYIKPTVFWCFRRHKLI